MSEAIFPDVSSHMGFASSTAVSLATKLDEREVLNRLSPGAQDLQFIEDTQESDAPISTRTSNNCGGVPIPISAKYTRS